MSKFSCAIFISMAVLFNACSIGGPVDWVEKMEQSDRKSSIKGMLRKQDLNGTLLYLLSDMSQYVNGQNVIVDDGFTL